MKMAGDCAREKTILPKDFIGQVLMKSFLQPDVFIRRKRVF